MPGLRGSRGFWSSYKACLSTSVDSPSSRFRCTAARCSTQGYTRADGDLIANDWADLTTCDGAAGECLAATLVLSEFNQPMTANAAWTQGGFDPCNRGNSLYCFQQG